MDRQAILTDVSTLVSEVQEISARVAGADPATGLQAVAALRRLVHVLEELQVQNARAAGWKWIEIAEGLGVTKQAVHQKYRRRAWPPRKGAA